MKWQDAEDQEIRLSRECVSNNCSEAWSRVVSDKVEQQQHIGLDEEDWSLFRLWHLPIIRLFSQLQIRDNIANHRVCIKQTE